MRLKRLLTLALAAILLVLPVSAAAEPSAWALSELTDSEAFGMLQAGDMPDIQKTVTPEKLDVICSVLDARLRDAGLEKKDGYTAESPTSAGLTRGAVMERLYSVAASYVLPEGVLPADLSAVEALQSLGVVQGYSDGSVQEERLCTLEEAFVMGSRCMTALIDRLGGGSDGFLWKAQKGGSTVYLLGTIHVNRGNIYPFGSQLRGVVEQADRVVFEVDFGNQAELLLFAALQVYSDGSGLSDHIDAALYRKTVELLAPYGYDESMVNRLKPWVVSNLLTSLQASEVEAGEIPPMVIDMYVYSKALVENKDIGQIEGFLYQGKLFDSLSEEYQIEYLKQCIELFEQGQDPEAEDEAAALYDAWVDMWIGRDIVGFEKSYDKDGMAGVEDELGSKLFGERDDHMSAYVKDILESGEEKTTLIVVGAGHMIGETGIVQQLLDAGYTVGAVETQE